ncbi:MAG: lysophospholipid acyltransferase family protein [Angustibacter sp.]
MTDLVYPPVIGLIKTVFGALRMRIVIDGAEHIPRQGGAVLASNHVSYLDFIFVGMAARPAGRLTRFMAKESVFRHRISGPLMRGMKHIPVDREAGTGAFRQAMRALKDGEIIGIFPEGTTSRSFTVKELKPGAVRLAQATRTPLIPVAVWGGQRIFSRGHPRKLLAWRRCIFISVGQPVELPRGLDPQERTEHLRVTLQTMLEDIQRRTPEQPTPGSSPWWHPLHLGGSAPTLAQAEAEDAAGPAS